MIQLKDIEYASYRLSYNLQYFADGPDKTEEPTAKKLSDARNEGQVAKSNELTSASGLAVLFISLKLFSGYIGSQFIETYKKGFFNIDKYTGEEFSIAIISALLRDALLDILLICLPIFVIAVIVSFVVVLFQVKWKISLKTMTPKFSKINPISGFKKIFSKDKIVEIIIEVLKIIVISYIAYATLKDEWEMLFQLYDMKLEQAILLVGNLVINLGLEISLIFLVIGVGDLIYQKFKFKKDMRMSKQEVKDEFKNSEGDPQIKGKIKQRMRESSMRRMMQNLPKADVVITNPTHLAAAIQYDKESSSAPVLLAKGADHLAEKIKEIARENQIEIVENKPLARMLYYNVEIGEEIPSELYQMTAEVLAYVYGLKNKAV
jgi:flagellar biosynthesis protein FlhB